MYIDSRNREIQHYRAVRQRGRDLAILRKEIRAANPQYSDAQVEVIAQASLNAKEASSVQHQGKRAPSRKPNAHKAAPKFSLTHKLPIGR